LIFPFLIAAYLFGLQAVTPNKRAANVISSMQTATVKNSAFLLGCCSIMVILPVFYGWGKCTGLLCPGMNREVLSQGVKGGEKTSRRGA
jgi:hypothetical protein